MAASINAGAGASWAIAALRVELTGFSGETGFLATAGLAFEAAETDLGRAAALAGGTLAVATALVGAVLVGVAFPERGFIGAFLAAALTGLTGTFAFGACFAAVVGLGGGFLGAGFLATTRLAFAGFLRAGELWEDFPRSVRVAPAMGEKTLPKALRPVKQWHCNPRRSLGFREA